MVKRNLTTLIPSGLELKMEANLKPEVCTSFKSFDT